MVGGRWGLWAEEVHRPQGGSLNDLPGQAPAPAFQPAPPPVLPRHTQEQKSAGAKPRGTSQPRERLLGKEGVNRAVQMTLRSFRQLSPGPSQTPGWWLSPPPPDAHGQGHQPAAGSSRHQAWAGRKGNRSVYLE